MVTRERLLETLRGKDGYETILQFMLLLINKGVITIEEFDQTMSKIPRY